MKNINSLLQEKARTSIFIAHRLRTVVEAGVYHLLTFTWQQVLTISPSDLIFVMSEGHIIEQGTHEQLMRAGGLYHSMWVEQASHMEYDVNSSAEVQTETAAR